MAGTKQIQVICIFAIFVTILNCVTIVQSDDSEEEFLITDEELYERQKQAFVDSLGYVYLENEGSNRLEEPDETTEDKGSHIDDTNDRLYVRKRSAGGSDPYGLIAGISGGSVIHTDKDNISAAVDILTTSTLTNPVILTRRSLIHTASGQVQFFVDRSLTRLSVEIKTSCCKPNIVVTDGTGNNITTSSTNVTVKVNTATMMYVDIVRTFVPGNWSLIMSAANTQDFDVTIRGSSLINFDLAFSDKFGFTSSGQPIPDSNSTYVKVTPLGADKVSNWTFLLIKAINGTLLQKVQLGALRGRTSKAFLLPVVWPNMDVHVGIQGLDNDSNTFTREQRTLVQPLGVRLLLDKAGAEFITSCNTPFIIPFSVTNTGYSGNFTYQITSDNKNFIATVSPKSVSITSHSTARGQASVTLITTPTSDKAVQLVISVLDSVSKAQYVTKTLIAKDVTCPDTVTYTHVISSTSSDTSASTWTPFNVLSLIFTLLLAHISVMLL